MYVVATMAFAQLNSIHSAQVFDSYHVWVPFHSNHTVNETNLYNGENYDKRGKIKRQLEINR